MAKNYHQRPAVALHMRMYTITGVLSEHSLTVVYPACMWSAQGGLDHISEPTYVIVSSESTSLETRVFMVSL